MTLPGMAAPPLSRYFRGMSAGDETILRLFFCKSVSNKEKTG
ncbi:hypothetical protein NT01EI_1034 [Edwardsiella ictaluri 93-146]|uniref:Uncharacterized protein n=1 Tax=Edwardsiella ictaluri (strain 93-146) TaxID=634503 RepID=C5BBH9_EDWI9|nr:hypothetical protein NT01EI_1034 [Edwardsiella ictaluri 93-146]